MYKYFILSPSPVFPGHHLLAYKQLSVYKNVQSGSVYEFKSSVGLPNGWIFIMGTVRASQSTKKGPYEVWVLMNRETVS